MKFTSKKTSFLFLVLLSSSALLGCQSLLTQVSKFDHSALTDPAKATKFSKETAMDLAKKTQVNEQKFPTKVLGNSYKLTIEGNRMPCDSIKPMQCLIAQVMENDTNIDKKANQDSSQNLSQDNSKNTENTENKLKAPLYIQIPYSAIEGFVARPGTRYVITAKPYIDQQSKKGTGKWQLESILTQKPVTKR